jgi:hypothetical protein
MNIADLTLADLFGILIGFFFTLMVFSYILGDNPLFRLTLHLFIGVAAGYAAMVAIYSVILPRLVVPLLSDKPGEQLLTLIPLLLSLLLLTKILPQVSRLGNISMAFLVGVGAAAAIGGAVTGTLFPQTTASINLFDLPSIQARGENLWFQLVNGFIILLGTITTLIYFHFGTSSRLNKASNLRVGIESLGQIGQFFIAITFGVLFAGVYSAALSALIERLTFFVDFLKPLLLNLIK